MNRFSVALAGLAASLLMGEAFAEVTANRQTNTVVSIRKTVEFMRAGATKWDPCYTNQVLYPGDKVRTDATGKAVIRASSGSVYELDALTTLEFAEAQEQGLFLKLLQGIIYFLHRDKPGSFSVETPTISAVIRGTEFNVAVTENGRTVLTVLDGAVEARNKFGAVTLTSAEQVIADPGQPLRKTAVINAVNVIQWCLYYPAVLDWQELMFQTVEPGFRNSLDLYRTGDLVGALRAYPPDRRFDSPSEEIFMAALLVGAGQVEKAEPLLTSATSKVLGATQLHRLAVALHNMISVVKFGTNAVRVEPQLATEWLVESYARQAQRQLEAAREAARQSVRVDTEFAFGWARLAEMEFSFGRTKEAVAANDRALALAPRNAQAHALKGFLLAAQNKIGAALDSFGQAISLDGALANGWLGRGLCRIRRGEAESGRQDLQVAALLEPNRALLRSYLGKAYHNAGDDLRAENEFARAEEWDPADPTVWLYRALLEFQENEINRAVRDLERSTELNQNRAVYRSKLLLDQDRAVRSANLAAIYQEAGLEQTSMREASRAVTADYANYSAHLFLANSYNSQRDPQLVTLRYETATASEYLLANLLGPVGGGILSPSLSQQEYSKLLERDRLGLSSRTVYLSRGDWTQEAAQFGTFDGTSYLIDTSYRSLRGERVNNDLDQLFLSAQIKQQLSPDDTLYLQAVYTRTESGDLRQYYDPNSASRSLRVKEVQEPNFFAGYHHEWSPQSHTLLLFARLDDRYDLSENSALVPTLFRDAMGAVTNSLAPICRDPFASGCSPFALTYGNRFTAYSGEAQQLWQLPAHSPILGLRFQAGDTGTESLLWRSPTAFPPIYLDPPASQSNDTELQRLSAYAYDFWEVVENFWLIGGITYERIDFPANIDAPPISSRQRQKDKFSPKAGLICSLTPALTLRAAYTRSLGGLFYDNSVRLEPTQIAGFTQAYRSLIPESVAGSIPGAEFETFGLGAESRLPTKTYFTAAVQQLSSKSDRVVGVFDYADQMPFTAEPSGTPQTLNYEEQSVELSATQLLGEEWSLGARYRLSKTELALTFDEIPPTIVPKSDNRSTLHQLTLFAAYNHPTGFFARAQSLWTAQSNEGYTPHLAGDNFWQVDAFVGFRFPHRRAELLLGVLNLTDADYHLNPLSLYSELPRSRIGLVSLSFNF